MGWASYLEDKIKRLETSIHMAQKTFEPDTAIQEHQKREALRALAEARAILAEAWEHLELATSPELESAHSLIEAQREIKRVEGELGAQMQEAKRIEHQAAERYAELVDAKLEIKELKKSKRKLEKMVEKLTKADYGNAVDVFTNENRIKKHKPGEI